MFSFFLCVSQVGDLHCFACVSFSIRKSVRFGCDVRRMVRCSMFDILCHKFVICNVLLVCNVIFHTWVCMLWMFECPFVMFYCELSVGKMLNARSVVCKKYLSCIIGDVWTVRAFSQCCLLSYICFAHFLSVSVKMITWITFCSFIWCFLWVVWINV